MPRIVSALVLVVLGACSAAPTEIPAGAARLRVGTSSVTLSLTAAATVLRSGSPDTLRATLANDGAVAVTLHFRSGCQILPYIRDAAGTVVLPGGGGWYCTAALTQLSLAPGASVVREFVWSGSTAFASEMPTRPLPPGTYAVTAEVVADEGALRTAPLTITLQ